MDYQRIFKAVMHFRRKGDIVKAYLLLSHVHLHLLHETENYLKSHFKAKSNGFCLTCGEEKVLDEQGQCQFCFNQRNNSGRGYYGPFDSENGRFEDWLKYLEKE